MRLINKEETMYKKKYSILGIKISKKKKRPSQVSMAKRIKRLKKLFYSRVNYPLDLANPQTFNEKINWLKLFYHNDLMTRIVDKHEFKNYIKEKLGDGYTVPSLGVWEKVEDIDFDSLPNQFVLKCNAQSDGKFIKIVKDKTELDVEALKEEMQEWLIPDKTLKTSFCWAYHNVPLRIIAEEYIEQIDGQVYDYKFLCFNGEVKLVMGIKNREEHHYQYRFYTPEWEPLDMYRKSIDDLVDFEKPVNYDRMLEFSKLLSKDFPFVRVDFYAFDDKFYIGEMTFYPAGGLKNFTPMEWDYKLGSWLKLPETDIKYKPPFFEKVKNKNERIFKIMGKDIFSYHKLLPKDELAENLGNTSNVN